MKKLLTKIGIGTIAFAVFLVIGYPKAQNSSTQNSQISKKQLNQKKGLINRGPSGQFTRGGNVPKNVNSGPQSRYGVIYIGEPTDGLLD